MTDEGGHRRVVIADDGELPQWLANDHRRGGLRRTGDAYHDRPEYLDGRPEEVAAPGDSSPWPPTAPSRRAIPRPPARWPPRQGSVPDGHRPCHPPGRGLREGLTLRTVPSVIRDVETFRAITGENMPETALAAVVWTAHAAAVAMEGLGVRDEPADVSELDSQQPNPYPQLANVAADLAAREAFTAAVDAACAVGFADEFIKGAMQDYQELLKLELGRYPEAGQPIDPSARGRSESFRLRSVDPRHPRHTRGPAPTGDLHDSRNRSHRALSAGTPRSGSSPGGDRRPVRRHGFSPGASWVEESRPTTSRSTPPHAERVRLLLFGEDDLAHPVVVPA